MVTTASIQSRLQETIDEALESSSVPGFIAGIWWDGESFEATGGTANLNTGVPMTADTSYLLGSISKIIVTSMLIRFVERGTIRLDDRVIDHLPELRLGDQGTLEELRVFNLVNHSSGIDAADYAPELGRGDDAVRRYVELLADKGQLYPLNSHISYCNPAFVIAGRLLEVLTGDTFDRILRREIFAPIGMERSCTSGDEAILHRAAIGHIVDPATNTPRPTGQFMLPYSMAPAGSTIITTISDLLRFARTHLAGGLTPDGTHLLATESVGAMASETIREDEMGGFAVGLGWLLPSFGGTKVLTHSGGSFGGISTLIVVPERQFACATFGNSTTAPTVHQRLQDFVLHEVLGMSRAENLTPVEFDVDPAQYVGTYEKQHTHTVITAGEEGPEPRAALTATLINEYDDDRQQALFREYTGRDSFPPFPLYPVTPGFFVPATAPEEPISVTRMTSAGLTFLEPDADGRFKYVSSGLRISRRVD